MTADDFREKCLVMLNRILAQGFEHPINFAAIDIHGLTLISSSSMVTSAAPPGGKTSATHGPIAMYLLPVNILFVDPRGKVAHAMIDRAGLESLRILN
jgi:hypothetical protein